MANLLSAKPKVALMTFGDERDYMWDGYFGPLTLHSMRWHARSPLSMSR
jgi:hypothetical protein